MRIIQIVGYKNSGKTTLTCELVRELGKQGRRVGTLKHDAHDFEPDVPGKDSWKHRQAGAHITAITSPSRTAWVQEQSTPIEKLVSRMESQSVDFLIIEGFKTASYPKIVLLRSEEDEELLALPNIVAVVVRESNASIEEMTNNRSVPLFVQPDTLSFGPLIEYVTNRS
ncbi:molybdopterin-guanine dinucleotide biosynthesis protein B [Cohnella herbarum]|uniref:Molybdopterin-guanine dinucleotide biosynthesis protein B n=1 Tax=Cohnella herbarum TaxID=2728023 RepID=A0A7Z2VIB6_9BACL|nr:molybdopterin-guanine dinucleotide biosynthesis protein B [Cohnella herbarum]QJD83756.1 molybdopterin-guanine dinucleotide biosynthesis protein B [Cohnella herbarum]